MCSNAFAFCSFRLPDGLTRRGDINLLMLGDPGTAKSQLLKFVERCSPIGVIIYSPVLMAFLPYDSPELDLNMNYFIHIEPSICVIRFIPQVRAVVQLV